MAVLLDDQGIGDGAAAAVALDRRLTALDSLEARVGEIRSAVAGTIAFSTSLGLEDQAILAAIAHTGAAVDVFTLDTGRLFPETLETLERTERRFGLRVRVVAPGAAEVEALVARDGVFGFRRSVAGRKACCHVRKVLPLQRALRGAQAWITGLRRGQSQARSFVPFAQRDPEHGLIKLNPLADWPPERVEGYIAAHDVPVNALHARGFPSIGCQPCTRAVKPGDDVRSGRWWWEQEDGKECGLHNNPNRPRVEAVR